VSRRTTGQVGAALGALVALALAFRGARASAMPEWRVYDGYWMILGAAVAVTLTAAVVWRWPRELSLVAIAIATVIGSLVPLALSALWLHMPLLARLRGAWVLGGADVVGPPLVIGFLCLWFAVRKHGIERRQE
jgi:hypothetical protein